MRKLYNCNDDYKFSLDFIANKGRKNQISFLPAP